MSSTRDFVRLFTMMAMRRILILGIALFLTSCFLRQQPAQDSGTLVKKNEPRPASVKKSAPKDSVVSDWTRYFAQADSIHREAWWVLTSERKPVGKSPFGKVERALLSAENIKLANKSIFHCDRYVVKKEAFAAKKFPQKAEILEKCTEKQAGKKIADLSSLKEGEVHVVFYPENLEEILGLGPTILNKQIECDLQASESGALTSLKCRNWSEDRSKEQMVRLDTYDYQKEGKNLIKLRGKIYENLSDIRKIEADVPLAGKIQVTETELYAPIVEKPSPEPEKKTNKTGSPGIAVPGAAESGAPVQNPPTIDPDLLRGRVQAAPVNPNSQPPPVVDELPLAPQQQQQVPAPMSPEQGWPVDENGQAISPDMLSPEQQQQMYLNNQQPTPPVAPPQSAPTEPSQEGQPHGR